MASSILITQCLQRDFVEPIGRHDPLPNLLHVGHAEATRLLGEDPEQGPLAQLMQWAHAAPPERLAIVHLRDWHDVADPRQHDHLRTFGPHCVADSDGARLVLGMDEHDAPNEHVVDTVTLNDFVDTELERVLARIRGDAADPPRVGVVGVWTEAKVSFLLYELKTRLGIDQLATCSALTASASRTQHFNALGQLTKILGVECFESVAGFARWLDADAELTLPPVSTGFLPELIGLTADAPTADRDRAIVGHLFRDSAQVRLHPLTGGFSEASVYRTESTDALGHRQAPAVVKVGPNAPIAQERVAFEQIEQVLGNNAPSVKGFVDLGDRAGIKFSFAAMGEGRVRTLKDLFETEPTEAIEAVLREALDEVLGPLYAAAVSERLPLLDHYQFTTRWSDSVAARIDALHPDAGAAHLSFPDGTTVANPVRFYTDVLTRTDLRDGDDHYVSYVHGDLNAANILVDARANVWVIDFFHAARGHVLRDLAKLENDLLFILTPLEDPAELAQALALSQALRQVRDLRDPLPAMPGSIEAPALQRAWRIIVLLRAIGARLCRDDAGPHQLDLARLRYAVHTLGFDESTTWQKQWALATAGMLAEDVTAHLVPTDEFGLDAPSPSNAARPMRDA